MKRILGWCMVAVGVAIIFLMVMLAAGVSISEAFVGLGMIVITSALIIGGLNLTND